MQPSKRKTISLLILAGLGLAGATPALAAYPDKPVRLIVPYSAGGPVDNLARALANGLSTTWGQPVVVDNRPGANEVIGATVVAKAAPDGYTLMLATDPTLSLNPYLFKSLSYDAIEDLVPVTRVAVSNMALAVPANLPVNDLRQFVAYAKANPGKVFYGSSGIGNGTHLSMSKFALDQGLEMNHVPYKGLAPTLQDMIGGNVQAAVGAVSVIAPFAKDGRVKVLGVSGPRRATTLSDVPTFSEAGFPGFEASFYYGIVAPAGIDPALKARIAADVKKVASTPEFQRMNLEAFALDSVLDTPEEFAAFLDKDRAAAKAKITASGASLD